MYEVPKPILLLLFYGMPGHLEHIINFWTFSLGLVLVLYLLCEHGSFSGQFITHRNDNICVLVGTSSFHVFFNRKKVFRFMLCFQCISQLQVCSLQYNREIVHTICDSYIHLSRFDW